MNNLILGNNLEILKTFESNSFDGGVTSPPYNKKGHSGKLVKEVIYNNISDNLPEDLYQKNQIEILNELYRIIKPGCSFFYNHKIRWNNGDLIHPMDWLRKTNWIIRQEIIWDRQIAANIRGWRFWQTDERIYWLYKPIDKNKIGKELLSKHSLLTSIWKIRPEQKVNHPAPFPLEIPVRCLYSVLNNEKASVIDPYMGSGTTGVACNFLGYNFTGIDISEEYIKYANERIKNYLSEKETFDNEIKKHCVIKSYKDRKKKS